MRIIVQNYTKKIKNNVVLDNVSVEMQSGFVYGLKGVNGSGKTMLMRAICGLIYPTSGKVIIDDKVVGKDISFPESVGILIENPAFLKNYTGFGNLKLLAEIQNKIDDSTIRQVLDKVGLDPDDKRVYRKYSLGMKQKLGIAAAVMESPEIIILDEPLNALDVEGVNRVKEIIAEQKAKGALIIVACHNSNELMEISDYIISIENGSIVSVDNIQSGDDNDEK